MELKIDHAIFEKYPDLKVGVILVKGINNTRRISSLESLLRGIAAQRGHEFSEKDMDAEPAIKVWNEAYGNFGVNPKKYPPSIAALLKRIKEGKEIPHINAIVDLYNYFSLKYLLPIGGEDLDWLCGDLQLAYTKGGEAFRPIGEIDVKEAKEGEIAYMDKGGITCRYWNHRECERTKFTNKTINAAIIVEDLNHMHIDRFGKILEEIAAAVKKYIGGRIDSFILNEDAPSLDLGIEGRKTADDGKITKQEKVHFMAEKEGKKKKSIIMRGKDAASKKDLKQLTLNLDEKAGQAEVETLNLHDESFLQEKIKRILEIAVGKAFEKAINGDLRIEYPASLMHGDYASNIAMHLAKILSMPPREIAEKIAKNISKDGLIEKVEVAGPGFINFFVSKEIFLTEMEKVLAEKEAYGSKKIGASKNLVMDYSAPNIAKPLGVHHLLSTIIGQTLYNVFQKLGFNCISINHIGDWGTQFGKLICAYKKWGDRKVLEKDPINEMLKLYVKFHNEAEKEPALEDEARKEFKDFEKGDKENRKLWEWFVEESLKDLNKTYDKLGGMHFDYTQGESFYEDKMEDILREGKEKGIFVRGEEDAYVAKYDDPDMSPLVVQKKDGATLYSTRDFATLKYRINEWHPAKIIYIVDGAQRLYFAQLFEAARRFPWYHDESVHVWFGRMQMKDKSMSTRKGNIVLLDEVLDEAVKRAKEIVEEKNPESKNKDEIARVVGIGAVKYNILCQNRITDIIFDWDKMLSLEGNSSPYLQYSYARAKSILKKAVEIDKSDGTQPKTGSITLPDPKDAEARTVNLLRFFPKFSEQLAMAAREYKPNIICNYLYELAQHFNSFYNGVPVLKAEKKEVREKRLKIVEAFSWILKNGLKLLGIEVVEEM